MSKVINRITKNTDNYKLDEVNCFQKPFGIILNSFDEAYSSAFYMFIKFYQAYNAKKYEATNLVVLKNNLQAAVDIVNNVFNIKCEKFICQENIHEFIENKIASNTRVLIPGDLRELFYAPQYMEQHHPHLFVVKGFDKEKKLYFIVDSMHINFEDYNYYDFYMQYDTLETIYKSSSKHMGLKEIYCFSKKNNEDIANVFDILLKCIDLYENALTEQPYKEVDYINAALDFIRSDGNLDKAIINEFHDLYNFTIAMRNTVKFKNVFLSELIDNLSNFIEDKIMIENLIEKKKAVIGKWDKIIKTVIANIYRKKLFNIEKALMEVNKSENSLRNLIFEVRDIIIDENKKNIKSFEHSWFFENNSDGIIKIQNNSVLFNFNNGKLYDFWTVDNSPKYLFNVKNNNMTIKAHSTIVSSEEDATFLAGIFLRTSNNSMYFYGLNSGCSIRLDQPGVNPNIIEEAETAKDIYLQVKIEDKKCIFEYYNNGSTEVKQLYVMSLAEEISELGFACKTWYEPFPLTIKFDYTIIYSKTNSKHNLCKIKNG